MNRCVVVVVYVVCGLEYDLAPSPFPFPIDPDVLQLPVLLQPCAVGIWFCLFVLSSCTVFTDSLYVLLGTLRFPR